MISNEALLLRASLRMGAPKLKFRKAPVYASEVIAEARGDDGCLKDAEVLPVHSLPRSQMFQEMRLESSVGSIGGACHELVAENVKDEHVAVFGDRGLVQRRG